MPHLGEEGGGIGEWFHPYPTPVMLRRFFTTVLPAGLDGLIITPAAVKRLSAIRASGKPGADQTRLRLSVEGGGCSGFSYQYKLVTEAPTEEDIAFERDGVQVLVDNVSLDLIKGSTLDYSEDMMRAAFAVIHNPRAEGGCGCGTSFRPKEEA